MTAAGRSAKETAWTLAVVSSSYTTNLRVGHHDGYEATPASNDIGMQASIARSCRTMHETTKLLKGR